MEITREHLELAAKAARYAGIDFSEVDAGGNAWRVSGALGAPWRPHICPADAWQLAADCKLDVDHQGERIWFPLGSSREWTLAFGDGTGRTAAEAVTLAAAEIGRAMG